MSYGKLDESTFSTYSKIICASIDCVNTDVLCQNAKKAIQEYIDMNDPLSLFKFDFQDRVELWNIFHFLVSYKEPIEDHSLQIISHFLTKPVIDVTIKGDHYWVFDWNDEDLVIWNRHWKHDRYENIKFLMDDNFVEFKDLWLRQESGEDISCERNFDLFHFACRLGFEIKRLFEDEDQLLVRLPITGDKYQSYYNEIPYNDLSYAA